MLCVIRYNLFPIKLEIFQIKFFFHIKIKVEKELAHRQNHGCIEQKSKIEEWKFVRLVCQSNIIFYEVRKKDLNG